VPLATNQTREETNIMTQIVLIEETSAVKTETKADKRKRESALKKQEREAS